MNFLVRETCQAKLLGYLEGIDYSVSGREGEGGKSGGRRREGEGGERGGGR